MSHIFDALQRSTAEQAGTEVSSVSVATEVLQAAEREVRNAAPDRPQIQTQDPQPNLDRFRSFPISVLPDSRLVCLTDKDSLPAEKFRFLGVRLRQMQPSRRLKKLLITSTIPQEGKSMVAANLACTLARRQQQKILLLDGDLRRPTLARQFGLGRLPGLSEWLQDKPGPMENIYRLEGPGFWFLPAGSAPENPLEFMQSGRLSGLLDQLAAWFDWIVVDSPPVLPLADTSIWVRMVDGILLVTRLGITEKRQLRRGLESLEQSKLLGTVLNGSINADHTDYYQRYGPATLQKAKVQEASESQSELV